MTDDNPAIIIGPASNTFADLITHEGRALMFQAIAHKFDAVEEVDVLQVNGHGYNLIDEIDNDRA